MLQNEFLFYFKDFEPSNNNNDVQAMHRIKIIRSTKYRFILLSNVVFCFQNNKPITNEKNDIVSSLLQCIVTIVK